MTSRILVIAGPTACGKSARALEIAQATPAVIINADAMQVYAEMRVLTARPSEEDEAQAPHALYGVLSAATPCSAALWLSLVRPAIENAWAEGRLPVVTGGTGLYLKALMEGLSPIPPVPPEAREAAQRRWDAAGANALLALDPAMHARLKPGDTQRHIRALEVMLATGRSLKDWQALPRIPFFPETTFETEIITLPRVELYARCDGRFLAMLEAGALEEMRALHALHLSPDLPALRAVGVPELMGVLDGHWDLPSAIARAQQATRQYAKRQMTWFRNQMAGDAHAD